MLHNKTISLVIPCKNEERALDHLLKKIPSCVDEVLVVDNNSSDSTRQVAQRHGARVLTEKRTHNGIGYGYAHQLGLKKATGDYVITMDGDGTYPISAIKQAISITIREDLDVLLCSRFPLRNPKAVSLTRRLGVFILNTEASLLFASRITDILSGMWVVKKSAKKHLFLSEGGWDFSPEIKLAALLHPQIKTAELHIHHSYRKGGESKQQIWNTGFGHLFFIFRYWWTHVIRKLLTNRLTTFNRVKSAVTSLQTAVK